jgi:hypothetical protein
MSMPRFSDVSSRRKARFALTTAVLASVLTAGFTAGVSMSQGDTKPVQPPTTEEIVKMLETASAPVEEHEVLEQMVGIWDQRYTMWIRGVETPLTSEGTSRNAWVLGKRFVLSNSATSPGQTVNSQHLGIYGFDTRTSLYTVFGVDTFGTYSVSATGAYDAKTKTLRLSGENSQPGRKPTAFRWELTFDSPTQTTLRIFLNVGDGEWFKATEVVSTKK